MMRSWAAKASILVAVSFAPTGAFADPGEEIAPVRELATRPPERSWLYLEEPQLPDPLHAVASTRVTYAESARPFATGLATPGAMVEATGELGVIPGVSLTATGVEAADAHVGALAGARFSLLPGSFRTTRAVVSAGYVREVTASNGAWARVALSQDFGRLRLATTLHGEHVFAAGRDAVDVMAMLGANVRVAGSFRAGAEYVAQDLEGAVDHDEAEQGVRHFLGPSASVALLDERLTLAGGPAFGLSAISPRTMGRVAIAYSF
jgi:hypothetical protein